ncbi:beta-propeller fold lactonase family protein [Sphingobium sufflavum]|uniref:YncE family protein n=1 Tax=Sphingobium sufflavum TaxID=1129547 RepID=UPI001F41B564|nr:cytochrome D1 domain-containing protein [Sphingobium sufflavum]MCE7798274.1 beta-propeller fold lactonase family protein [Sphingobium sufflavum]
MIARFATTTLVTLAMLTSAVPALADTLLVANKGEDTVSFLDLASGKERARIPTGRSPHEIVISPNGKLAAVVAYGGATIDIMDIKYARLVRRIDLTPNAGPHGIVWPSHDTIVAVADRSQSVVIVNPRSGAVEAIPTGQKGSHMLALSPNRRFAYVSNILSGTVSIVDLQRKTKTEDIRMGGNPEGIALTHDGNHLWVGDDATGRVQVVDLATRKVITTLPTDPVPVRIAISPDGKTAITSNFASGTLNRFDVATRRPLPAIKVSGDRAALQVTILFARKKPLLYVAETGRDTVAEVDLVTGAVIRRLPTGKNGDGLAIAP